MGLYDSIIVNCPECGEEHEFQSKSGDCLLNVYTLNNCPDDVLSDVNRHSPAICDCGAALEVDDRKVVNIKNSVIYVASPYSDPDENVREERYNLVSKYCAYLVSKGLIVISPITYGHTLLKFKEMPTDFEFWNNFCLALLKKCDYLYVLKINGWDNSIGIKEEIEFAKKNNIKIRYVF